MNETEFCILVAEILETESATVSLQSSLDDLGWDSLANITFIAELDERLGVSVNSDELLLSKTVADLYQLAR